MDPRIFPGPENSELLYLEKDHRAYHLFHSQSCNDKPLTVRRADQTFWLFVRNNGIPQCVREQIKKSGFLGVFDCGYKKVDNGLVTALVERWRPETHTFHFIFGEATITLQDVQVLWGLPIGDDVVSGTDIRLNFPEQQWLCYHMLGMHIEESDVNGQHLKLSRVLQELMSNDFPENSPPEECIKRARLYILHLLGGSLFPDASGNAVFLHLLNNLRDLEECGRLSWASAVLAYMYRNLCKASKAKAKEIYGPTMLLQLWAWERIPPVAPQTFALYDFEAPYGARWNGRLSFSETPSHALKHYRSQLQALHNNEFNWTPYLHVEDRLKPEYISGKNSWRCVTALIFWEVVEPHLPNRVMRQFGMVQPIPENNFGFSKHELEKLHKSNRKNNNAVDWLSKHGFYVQMWNSRLNNVVIGEPCNPYVVSQDYMTWFLNRTVYYITNPGESGTSRRDQNLGGRLELLGDGLSQVYRTTDDLMQSHPENVRYFQPIQNIAQQCLGLANAHENMHFQPSHLATNPNQYDFPQVPLPTIERPHVRRDWEDQYFRYSHPVNFGDDSSTFSQNLNFGEDSSGFSQSLNYDEDSSSFSQNQNLSLAGESSYGYSHGENDTTCENQSEGPSSFNQQLGFSQWANREGGSNLGFSQVANQASGSVFGFSQQVGGSSPHMTDSYSNDFMSMLMSENFNYDPDGGQQRRNLVSPVPFPNISDNELAEEEHQQQTNQPVRRGNRQRRPKTCHTGSRLGHHSHH